MVPWPWLRWILLILAGYSRVLLLGFFATRITRPHLLTNDELILRSGHQVIAQTDPLVLDGRLFLPGLWERRRKIVVGVAAIRLHVDDPQALQRALTTERDADAPAPCDRPA